MALVEQSLLPRRAIVILVPESLHLVQLWAVGEEVLVGIPSMLRPLCLSHHWTHGLDLPSSALSAL
jgi:hypothetical protein